MNARRRRRQTARQVDDGGVDSAAEGTTMNNEPRHRFRFSQETIAIATVGVALATLMLTMRADIAVLREAARADREAWQADARQLRDEARADREAWRAEARADREKFSSEILRLTGEVATLAAAPAEQQ